jgi:membrane-associated HD superfamily phosphohydrolase
MMKNKNSMLIVNINHLQVLERKFLVVAVVYTFYDIITIIIFFLDCEEEKKRKKFKKKKKTFFLLLLKYDSLMTRLQLLPYHTQ